MTPVVLFVYNRPNHTLKTLESLERNTLSRDSDLIVFADGAKENATDEQMKKIDETRKIVKMKKWCKTVSVKEFAQNKGLAANIIDGVTEIVNKYGSAIVLEDDIVTGKFFLEYMNDALEKYKDEKKVFHITGWRNPIKKTSDDSCFFYPRMDCWGWATWADRWNFFKKDPEYFKSIFSKKMRREFDGRGSERGTWGQIEANANGTLNTWAVFWGASIFIKNGLCLAPSSSLVKNIGMDNSGEHCGFNKHMIIRKSIDNKIINFPDEICVNKVELKRNRKFSRKLNRRTAKEVIYLFVPNFVKNIYRKYFKRNKNSSH